MQGRVEAICICPVAGELMQTVDSVLAIKDAGLKGDRYCTGDGSFNKGKPRNRQVTLINGQFFKGSGFDYANSRRNIVTLDVELMDLIGKEFRVGGAVFMGLRYCDPCDRPSRKSGKALSFREAFFDRGGLIAAVIEGGEIRVGDAVIPPKKNY